MIDRRTLLRALGAGASVTVAGGSIVSCTNRPVGENRDPDIVKVWGIWASDAEKEAKIVEAFSEKHPDIKIQISQVPSNGQGDASSVITAVRGRTGPDVYFMDRFNGAQFASLGLLEPIDDLIEEYEGVSPEEFMSRMGQVRHRRAVLRRPVLRAPDGHGHPRSVRQPGPSRTKPGSTRLCWTRRTGRCPTTRCGRSTISSTFRTNAAPMRGSPGSPGTTRPRCSCGPWPTMCRSSPTRSCHTLLDSPEMLAVATMYEGWVEKLDFPRLDAFKATYQPPNAPPTQTSFFSDRQLFQITRSVGRAGPGRLQAGHELRRHLSPRPERGR